MLYWHIKREEAITKAKEVKSKKQEDIYTKDQVWLIEIFHRLVRVFFRKEQKDGRS